jgi:hypothetical protein
MHRLLATAFLAAITLASPAQEILLNPGLEGTYAGTATSWTTNTWGDAIAATTRETSIVQTPGSAQKYTVTLGVSGGTILLQPVTTVPGQSYRASIWVRGTTGMRVQLHLRQPGLNYRTAATSTITFPNDTTWYQLEGRGGFPSLTDTQFVITPLTSGTIYLDNASLQPETLVTGGTEDPNAVATSSFFGVHYNKIGSYPLPAAASAFGLVRLWDTGTKWKDIQPNAPTGADTDFTWTRTDFVLNQVETSNPGATVLMTLGITPLWASARPTEYGIYGSGTAAEPNDFAYGTGNAYWTRYVRALATRYKGRIDAYEIWNEADYNAMWTGGPAKLLELARIAYTEIKAIDPAAVILSPNFTSGGGPRMLGEYLDLGGAAYADVISCHVYFDGEPEIYLASLRNILFLSAQKAPGKPVWNTESTVRAAAPATDPSLARGYVARLALLQWAAGIRNFTW